LTLVFCVPAKVIRRCRVLALTFWHFVNNEWFYDSSNAQVCQCQKVSFASIGLFPGSFRELPDPLGSFREASGSFPEASRIPEASGKLPRGSGSFQEASGSFPTLLEAPRSFPEASWKLPGSFQVYVFLCIRSLLILWYSSGLPRAAWGGGEKGVSCRPEGSALVRIL
jgi:hypothetical protein